MHCIILWWVCQFPLQIIKSPDHLEKLMASLFYDLTFLQIFSIFVKYNLSGKVKWKKFVWIVFFFHLIHFLLIISTLHSFVCFYFWHFCLFISKVYGLILLRSPMSIQKNNNITDLFQNKQILWINFTEATNGVCVCVQKTTTNKKSKKYFFLWLRSNLKSVLSTIRAFWK